MQYRRAFVPGGSYFFTVVTDGRRPILQTRDAVEHLRHAFRSVRRRHPFTMNAAVVLPDHLHCIWTLPPGDADFPTRWRLIKSAFTRRCDAAPRTRYPNPCTVQPRVWQHRYWEHLLRDERDHARHVDYIHFNPVKHGLAATAMEWPYSSFRRYVAHGYYDADWGAAEVDVRDVGHE